MFLDLKVLRLIFAKAAFALTVTCPLIAVIPSVHAQQNAENLLFQRTDGKVIFRRKRSGIDAELDDQGDYYLHPNGSKIQMFRKKDVYVIDATDSESSLQRLNDRYGQRVQTVQHHRLGNRKVIKVDNSESVKRRRNEQFDVNASMLKSADNSIRNLKPVFTNARGEGDILLMPKLTVKLANHINPNVALNRLDRRYGLVMDRKIRISGSVYSLSLKTEITESQQFALVRSVMNDPLVEWAEPSFVIQPFKTSYTPNDPLLSDQWHVRNTGYQGSRCDTDCDVNNAWGIDVANNNSSGGTTTGANDSVAGAGIVIAVIDDGVQLNHPDLAANMWTHPNETENDADGYIGDINGWDFVDEDGNGLKNSTDTGPCLSGDDGTLGPDNDPSPQPTTDCITANGDDVEQDHHGTAVAGLAAAVGHNNIGVAGTAFKAEILPIRLVSEFDNGVDFCLRAAEAIAYAGRYADVISNSWGVQQTCNALEDTIADVVSGNVAGGNGSAVGVLKRPGLGSPVIFSSGNNASGWVKVTIPVSAGEHAYEWRFLRDGFNDQPNDGDQAWLDDITWPGDSSVSVDFETNTLAGYGFDIGNVEASNSCIPGCSGFLMGNAAWSITSSPEPLFGGTLAARVDASNTDCGNTYLHIIREEAAAGNLSFWVWVDSNTGKDKFEFLIDGEEVLSLGDFPSFVENGVLTLQAELSTTIAVGSSNSGDLSGLNPAGLQFERRAFYSQYGASLDVLAPSSDQSLGVVTTDRTGTTDGYNDGSETIGNSDYTNTFGGTSASAPMVAGIAASILAVDPTLSAEDVRDILRRTTDKIGDTSLYSSDGNGDTRSDFYGYGRVNMFKAILDADPQMAVSSAPAESSCAAEPFSFVSGHTIFAPFAGEFCPAIGEIPQGDEMCFPIKASNNKVAVICL
ncbi:MAG: S8 family serine peptidase [Acidiferrobacterales bacterium]|nr:S8 family serine peptidase [Acidiferrobacterales bacterium]